MISIMEQLTDRNKRNLTLAGAAAGAGAGAYGLRKYMSPASLAGSTGPKGPDDTGGYDRKASPSEDAKASRAQSDAADARRRTAAVSTKGHEDMKLRTKRAESVPPRRAGEFGQGTYKGKQTPHADEFTGSEPGPLRKVVDKVRGAVTSA